jgi:hypothetical protein
VPSMSRMLLSGARCSRFESRQNRNGQSASRVCQHHTDRQAGRQTDHGIYHAMPRQGGRGGISVEFHAIPCHNSTVAPTSTNYVQ